MEAGDRSKCLLDNWVEERATAALDSPPPSAGCVSEGFFHRNGHPGLITVELLSKMADLTTTHDSFRRPVCDVTRQKGKREEMIERLLYSQICKETFEKRDPPPPKLMETESTMQHDYQVKGFKSIPPPPSKEHDYLKEQPTTFWTENVHKVTGISNIRTRDIPFKKNATFTTPIDEYLDEPMPYTLENYPNL
ncbi:sperm-associated antigen 8-like [Rhinatrema bivittatum]|uniref:sperm-associated antigen 8 n=1 Tax=Rhinatrema bivittatum TaxID=194408 RepID=UPI00112666B4|nr:sperm-associated antigen 8 [Rhinatrema bivittatum]XP_029442377.1 sperm-associated antigen 8-like [Rhinatrema bivittatum]